MFLTIQPQVRPNPAFGSEAMKIFSQSLGITLHGMAGIFVAIIIFYAAIKLLGRVKDRQE
jgi:Na+-transporting methylmalonyl-CoA/oxaloacetate decarboxylase gamma subunit